MAQLFFNSFSKYMILLSFIVISGCGGGGGGGSATLPKKVSITFPEKNQTVTSASQEFEVTFTNGSVEPENLQITLNGVDVTPSFKVSATSAKASIYALSAILKDGSENFFNAKAINPSSAIAGLKFNYDAFPEIILTSVTGSDPYSANGETRKSSLVSVSLNGVDGLTALAGKAFSFSNVTIPMPGALMQISPDFTIVATDTTDDVESVDLVVPKAKIKYGAGVQLNSTAFNVIEKWVVTILEKHLPGIISAYITNPHPVNIENFDASVLPVKRDSSLIDNSICTIVNLVSSSNYTDCSLYLTEFSIPSGAMTTDVQVVESSDPEKFILQVRVLVSQINTTIDLAGYQSLLYQGAFKTDLQLNDILYTVDLEVSKGTGIVKFVVPAAIPSSGTTVAYSPYSFSYSDLLVLQSSCSTGFCAVADEAARNDSLENYFSFGGTVLTDSVLKTSENAITSQLNKFLTELEVSNQSKSIPVKNDVDVQVSSINFDLFGSVINEAKTTTSACGISKVCGGFIGLGGSTYSDDTGSGYDRLALGSYFDPVDSSSVVGDNLISSGGDVMIALSENSMNQLLLAIFQSRLLAAKKISMEIKDLGVGEGELGKQIIDSTASFAPLYNLSETDDVEVAFDMEAVPRSQFYKNSSDSGLELSLYALRIKIDVFRNGVLLKQNPQQHTVNMLLDVKALLTYGLNEVTFLPQASVQKDNVAINVVSLESFNNIISQKTVLEAFPEFLAGQIENFAAGLSEPIVSNVELKGVGLVGKSWLVIDNLEVDSANEFILLSTRVVDVDPTPKIGIFNLNVTDVCVANPATAGCPP